MKFSSRKDYLFTSIIMAMCLLLGSIIGFTVVNSKSIISVLFPIIITFLVLVFLIWIFLDTNYEISKTHVKYFSGPIRGKIEVNKIRKIISGKTLWVGLKPATAKHGLILKYNKFDEIYISPETNEKFISEILKINPDIEIIKH